MPPLFLDVYRGGALHPLFLANSKGGVPRTPLFLDIYRGGVPPLFLDIYRGVALYLPFLPFLGVFRLCVRV